jgi:hypothetical protein
MRPLFRAAFSLFAKTMRAKRGQLEDVGAELGAWALFAGSPPRWRISGDTAQRRSNGCLQRLDEASSRASFLPIRPVVPVSAGKSALGATVWLTRRFVRLWGEHAAPGTGNMRAHANAGERL